VRWAWPADELVTAQRPRPRTLSPTRTRQHGLSTPVRGNVRFPLTSGGMSAPDSSFQRLVFALRALLPAGSPTTVAQPYLALGTPLHTRVAGLSLLAADGACHLGHSAPPSSHRRKRDSRLGALGRIGVRRIGVRSCVFSFTHASVGGDYSLELKTQDLTPIPGRSRFSTTVSSSLNLMDWGDTILNSLVRPSAGRRSSTQAQLSLDLAQWNGLSLFGSLVEQGRPAAEPSMARQGSAATTSTRAA